MDNTNPATGETAEPSDDHGIREFVDRKPVRVRHGAPDDAPRGRVR